MIRALARIIKVLNAETEPGQVSLAVVLALVAGWTPLFSLHNLVVLLLVSVLRVNLSAFLVGLAVFSTTSYVLDPLFHRLGLAVLTASFLEPLWNRLYASSLFRLEYFNHTITMGSLLASLVLALPTYLLLNTLIRRYREHVLAWVRKTRLAQLLRASRLYQAYQSLSGWPGGAG